jgi:hypothetical protein
MIEDALKKFHWNKPKSVSSIRLKPPRLRQKLKEFGLARFESHTRQAILRTPIKRFYSNRPLAIIVFKEFVILSASRFRP